MRDVINALKHYQNLNISINNPRYKEFDIIVATIENALSTSKNSPQFQRSAFLEWAEESLSECIRGD